MLLGTRWCRRCSSQRSFSSASTSPILALCKRSPQNRTNMPSLLIKSNVEASEPEREALMKECSAAVASCTGKPESFILVSYEKTSMIFGGTSAPCAYTYLASLGALGPSVNPSVVKAISDVLGSRLGIPLNRIYVQFCDVKDRGDFGWNGTTFG